MKSMSIWNRVALGLVGLAAVGLFIIGVVATLKIHVVWGSRVEQLRADLKRVTEENQALLASEDHDKPGILAMRRQLQQVLIGRGRVWYNCEPQQGPDTARSGKVAVTTDLPVPNGIANKSTLYVVEEAEVQKGGRYLGEFHVEEVAEKDKKISLAPNMKFSPEQLQRLAGSKGPWTLYENMPVDRHDVFVELSDAEKKSLLPPRNRRASISRTVRRPWPAIPTTANSKRLPGRLMCGGCATTSNSSTATI